MKAASSLDFIKGCLTANPLFADLPAASLDQVARITRMASFAPETHLVTREEEMTFAGVVVSGGIRALVTNADGHEYSLSILGRGSFFGPFGLLEPTTSEHDCIAYGPTEIACFAARDFRVLMRDDPHLVVLVARGLHHRLRKAYGFMVNQLLENLDARLRRTLIMLAGARIGGSSRVPEIPITQELLGNFVQCSRPSVNKALRDLERRGIIEIGYSVIRILDIAALSEGLEGETILTR